VVGKIPNFLGAEAAADQLAALPAWETAQVIKANPDKAQRAVRARALTEGKVLYMAVPRLADELPSDGCCCADVPAPKTVQNRSRATLSSPEAYASSPTVPR
jgi:5-formyltetrahydrofolate cyclo-ligase